MSDDRPKVIVIDKHDDHGCLITILLALIAWPLALIYALFRIVRWAIGTTIDWLTLGPLRRLGRRRSD
jgi:hypothetical protein